MKKTCLFIKVSLVALLFFSTSVFSQDRSIEYKIKAAYLYNFTKFIVWPDNKQTTFNLCILGDDPFGDIINPIESRVVNDKSIKVYRLKSSKQVKQCHIIYFGGKDSSWNRTDLSLAGVLTITSHQQTLSVGDSDTFTQSGGMIAFVLREGKIRLKINLAAIRKSQLEISAQLLEVAEIVKGESND